MMLGPSSAHEDNGKRYFVNQNVCTNAQCHLTIRGEQCHPTFSMKNASIRTSCSRLQERLAAHQESLVVLTEQVD
jgi:hypothetical protein